MLENNVRIIKHKVGLLNPAEKRVNMSRACKTMGLSRDIFYCYKAAKADAESLKFGSYFLHQHAIRVIHSVE